MVPNQKVLLLILLLALSFAACQAVPVAVTPTPAPTQTETPVPTATIDWFPRTPTPTPRVIRTTPTSASVLQPPANWQELLKDDFRDPAKWAVGKSSAGTIVIEGNALTLALTGSKAELNSLSTHKLPGEFYLEMTVDTSLCSEDDAYGIIFWRFSEMGTYRYLANCQGELSLERVIYDKQAQLIPWTPARRLQPGAPAKNRLGIWAKQGILYFFVNDTYQFELPARQGLSGVMGVTARSAGDLPQTVIFSDLQVLQP